MILWIFKHSQSLLEKNKRSSKDKLDRVYVCLKNNIYNLLFIAN